VFSFYVGYDKGDPILDDDAAVKAWGDVWDATLKEAFDGDDVDEEEKRLWKELGAAHLGLRMFRMDDTDGAPSWGVTHLAQAGYDAGADYLFQLNDDVELVTPGYTRLLIDELAKHAYTDDATGKSYQLGVSGPKDKTTSWLLTQTFVHRTHMEIFDTYFPIEFRNWHSDNWLTRVYGPFTHRKHAVTLKHQTGAVGKRYPVYRAGDKLEGELRVGRDRINAFIREKRLTANLIKNGRR
jgi:hypothetical protein